jgi:hypothetical protein
VCAAAGPTQHDVVSVAEDRSCLSPMDCGLAACVILEWVVCDCRPPSGNGGVPSSFVFCNGDPTLESSAVLRQAGGVLCDGLIAS